MALLIGQAYARTYLPDLDFIVIVAAAVGHTHCYGDWLFDPSIVNFVNLFFAEVFVEVVIWIYMQLMVGIILGSAHGAITSLLGQRYHSSLPTRPTTSRRTQHNDQHTHTYTHTSATSSTLHDGRVVQHCHDDYGPPIGGDVVHAVPSLKVSLATSLLNSGGRLRGTY